MSATFYTPGQLYSVGTNPALKLLNVRNTRTFSEFIVRGASTGPVLPGQKLRLRNYPDAAGPEVYPYGRATGQPGLVPAAPGPEPLPAFWAAMPSCGPTGALGMTQIADALQALYSTELKSDMADTWMYAFGGGALPWAAQIISTHPWDPREAGVYSITTCFLNDTGADATPKIQFFTDPSISVTVTGTFKLIWNNVVLAEVTNGTRSFSGEVFTAPATLPAGRSATSEIKITVENTTSLTGITEFKYTL